MASRPRLSSSQWEKRLLGHARFLAEKALAPEFFESLANRFSEEHHGVVGILNYDRRLKLLPEAGFRGLDANDFAQYRSHFAGLNPFTRIMKRRHVLDRTVVLSRYLPTRDFVRTEYYNDFSRRLGGKYALSLSLMAPEFGRTSISYYRDDKTGGDFDDEDARRFNQLRPFVQNALLLRALVRERGEAGKGIGSLRDPAFVVSKKGRLQPLNSAGEDLLCRRCKAVMPNARADVSPSAPASVVPLPLSGGVVVTLPGEALREELPRTERLRQRFGLTLTEAAVAGGLLDGLSYREIAEEFEVSCETVHSHVTSIHRKAGVSATRQFVALFLSGR